MKRLTPQQLLKRVRDVRDRRNALHDLEEDLLLAIDAMGGLEVIPDALLDLARGECVGDSLWIRFYREKEERTHVENGPRVRRVRSIPSPRAIPLLEHQGGR